MKFFYMDENYADETLPRAARFIALTGLLVPASQHREIRARFYAAVADAVGRVPNTVPSLPEIHAANLLPECNDEVRISFLYEIVNIVVDFELEIFRVGYFRTPELLSLFKADHAVVGICFGSLLNLLEAELERSAIWPVMETDRKNEQDQIFAGNIQFADYIEAHLGSAILTRDSTNLGEVLYSTKKSIHGSIVDCVAYLLKLRTIASLGVTQTPYKRSMCEVAERLAPVLRYDKIVKMRIGPPSER